LPARLDRLDIEEWQLLNESPTKAELIRAMLNNVEPTAAAEFLASRLGEKV
jgi:hypothetical protein